MEKHVNPSSEEIKKKKDRERRLRQMKKGLNNFQIQMQNSIIWKAFDRKIEDRLKFLHLKKFTEYLSD